MNDTRIRARRFHLLTQGRMTLFLAIFVGHWCVLGLPTSAQNIGGMSAPMIYEGFTEPRFDILVAATEVGLLESISVELGDRVEAGQVLGELENALQKSAVNVSQVQAKMRGELMVATADIEHTRRRVEHLRQLAADGMARPDELARAETEYETAQARKLVAEETIELRQLELERYQLQLERRKIRSPMSGVISQVFHQPGEYITPGDPSLVQLLVVDSIRAVFNVPVEDIPGLRVGASVRVFMRSSQLTLKSKISSIAPDIDGESGTVQVRVEIQNKDGRLLVGDRCTLQLASSDDQRQTRRHIYPDSVRKNSLR